MHEASWKNELPTNGSVKSNARVARETVFICLLIQSFDGSFRERGISEVFRDLVVVEL